MIKTKSITFDLNGREISVSVDNDAVLTVKYGNVEIIHLHWIFDDLMESIQQVSGLCIAGHDRNKIKSFYDAICI